MERDSSIRRVVRDIVDLFELQMQLLSVDAQSAQRKLNRAIGSGVTALVLAGSALTVLMFGAGFALHELTELTVGVSLLIVSGVIFLFVLGLLFAAYRAILAAAASMSETKSEFTENLRWLKATLLAPETSVRNQLRDESFPRYAYDDRSGRPNGSVAEPSRPERPTPTQR